MNWPVFQLQEVAEVNPRSREWANLPPNTPVGFVPMAAVSEETAAIVKIETRPLEAVRKGFTPFRDNDVLLAKITPCMENGKAALARGLPNGIGFGSTEFHVLRARDGVLPEFLYFFIRQPSFRAEAKTRFRGAAGQQRVPEDFLTTYSFPLPAPKEQRRIVELLEQADGLRRQRAEADQLTERILPALFLKMFGDPATNPNNFPSRRFRSLAIRYSDGPFGSNLKSDHYVEEGIRVVRLQNIGAGKFIDDDKAYIAKDHFAELVKHECRPGDVLIGTLGDPNIRACVQPEYLSVALNKADCVQFRADPSQCTPEYVCWLVNSPSTLAMARSLIAGQTRPRISMGRLGELAVPRPPLPLQQKFSWQVKLFEPSIGRQANARYELERLFSTMLHRAFTGELTAKWREAHMKELLTEMEQQARLLKV